MTHKAGISLTMTISSWSKPIVGLAILNDQPQSVGNRPEETVARAKMGRIV